MRSNLVAALLVAGMVMAAGCVGGDDNKSTTSPTPTGNTGGNNTTGKAPTVLTFTAKDTPTPPAQQLMSLKLTGGSPKANESVIIELKGDGQNQATHSIIITGPGAPSGKLVSNVKVQPVKSTANFTLQKGTYNFICGEGTAPAAHKDLGMSGSFTVA